MLQCTAHPAKGDMAAFEGLPMEQEEQMERFAIVQLNQLLYSRPKMSHFFSKELTKLADPYYGSSDDDSPLPRRRQRPRAPAAARPAAGSSADQESEIAEEEEIEDLSSMAAYYEQIQDSA